MSVTVEKRKISPPEYCRDIPITETSWPLGAAHRLVEPIDLSEYGFAENEYILGGKANVYEWPENRKLPSVRTPECPYASRMLVRKPAKPEDFSGTVVVELLNWASTYDRTIPGWGHCYEYYLSRGIAWIGLTVRERVFPVLKRFDMARYSELSFDNPLPEDERKDPANSYGPSNRDSENGLCWDMISQLGALLKSDRKDNPFNGFQVKTVIATAATGGDLSAYASGIHPQDCLESGAPVYDGFLIYMTGAPGGINQITPKNHELDERNKYYCEVPFIHILTTGDMLGGGFHPDWAVMQDRPDADEPGKKLRLYNIAGCGVRSGYDKQRTPCIEDVERSKTPWKDTVNYEYEYPVRYILKAATENLLKWITEGTAPPVSPRIRTIGKYPDTLFVLDDVGNTQGGIRLPYVDVPLYRYDPEGGAVRLKEEEIKSLYTDRFDYIGKVIVSTLRALEGRWILEEDAVQIILEAVQEDLGD